MQNLGRDFGLFRDLCGRFPREAALEGKRDLGQLDGLQGIYLQFPGMLYPNTESEAGSQQGQTVIPNHASKGTAQNIGTRTGSMFHGRDRETCRDGVWEDKKLCQGWNRCPHTVNDSQLATATPMAVFIQRFLTFLHICSRS